MQLRRAQHEAVQGPAQVVVAQLRQGAADDGLVRLAQPRHAHGQRLRPADARAVRFLGLEQLRHGPRDRHEPRREPHGAARLRQHVKVLLAHLDVQQAERVQVAAAVVLDLAVEGRGPPGALEEGDGHRLAVAVQLQPTLAHGAHDARVQHDLDRRAHLPRAQRDVRVRRRAERVADHEQGDVPRRAAAEDLVALALDRLARRDLDGPPVEGLELGHVDAQHARVALEPHLVARAHGLEAAHRDVLLVAQAEAHQVEDHGVAVFGAVARRSGAARVACFMSCALVLRRCGDVWPSAALR
mmetsp:Transcript_4435/g.13114  ORF Transcript_4435/g.13114 Transcript_4435/m.13114 type:complete len:299 (+) Transcript_4435:95-991(+)